MYGLGVRVKQFAPSRVYMVFTVGIDIQLCILIRNSATLLI